MRSSDTFVIAAWAGLIFGLAEGLVLDAGRANPVLFAPYKLSAHVIWVAPVVDIIIFVSTAPALVLLLNIGGRRFRRVIPVLVYGWFLFSGYFAVLSAPKLLHIASAAMLSLGLATITTRRFQRRGREVTNALRRKLFLIPVLTFLTAGMVFGFERLREASMAIQLSDAGIDAPNVLIIVMDTVRYDRFESSIQSSSDKSLAPYLDQLAAKGVRYENAWSTTSWTLPSQASILTGLYPHEHGADWPNLALEDDVVTLPDYFSDLGYATAAFSGNSSWVTPEYLGRGFLRFNVYIWQDFVRRTSYGRAIDLILRKIGFHYAGYGKKAPQINTEFLQFLSDYPERPFFTYICYMDVNQAFHKRQLGYGFWEQPPPTQEVIQAYDQGLSILDAQVGDLFRELERRGVLQNTVVVITSDHGESFGSTDTEDHDPEGHGTSLYPEQTRVPLFVVYPGRIAGNQRIDRPVSIRAIPATIIGLLDLAGTPFAGDSLPLKQSQAASSEQDSDYLLATLNYDKYKVQSLVWEYWLFIKNLNHAQDAGELYNLTEDPLAKENLETFPQVVSLMRQRIDQSLASRRTMGN